MPEYMTIPEVARLLRLGQRTTYELARTGKLVGATKIGFQWRVSRKTLTEWVARGGKTASQARPHGTKRATEKG